MLRRFVKTGLASAVRWTGADRLAGVLSDSSRLPLVVGYHRVVEDFSESAKDTVPAMLISRRMLEQQLDWIGRRFRFVSLDDLGLRFECRDPFEEPVAAVTFDDGYADVYHHAVPLLKRKGIPAAVFVVTDLIGATRLPIHEKLYLLLARAFSERRVSPIDVVHLLARLGIRPDRVKRIRRVATSPATAMWVLLDSLPQDAVQHVMEALEAETQLNETALREFHPLSEEMLSEMHRSGITIGSHTKTHALLTNESREKILDETAGSRRELEKRLGVEIRHFAYPNGQFNPAVVGAVAAAGYRFGYTSCRHRDPRYPLLTLPRHLFWEESCLDTAGRFSEAVLSCHTSGIFRFTAACRRNHGGPPLSG
jgi:peptidoglycan/xylan/chitin deacetylase (PgdA/CDA1 family)